MLWGSWAVKQFWSGVTDRDAGADNGGVKNGVKDKEREASVWFTGDTGYQTSDGPCPVFKGQLVRHHASN